MGIISTDDAIANEAAIMGFLTLLVAGIKNPFSRFAASMVIGLAQNWFAQKKAERAGA